MTKDATGSSRCAEPYCIVFPILMYHHVEPAGSPKDKIRWGLGVDPEKFAMQVTKLKEDGYQTVFMSEAAKVIAGSGGTVPKQVALTFDDGYDDFAANVMPVLKRENAKATLYVIVDFIGKPGYLTLAQLHDIVASGLVEIGSHTFTHIDLRKVNAKRAWREIGESKTKLEELLSVPVPTFAYPSGKYNAQALAMVTKAGYVAAVSTDPGSRQWRGAMQRLARIRIPREAGVTILKSSGKK